jgi:hypothetical protein
MNLHHLVTVGEDHLGDGIGEIIRQIVPYIRTDARDRGHSADTK